MLHRFDAFVSGISACYKYIQRIKSSEMIGFGLRGTHAMCLYYLRQNPKGLTSAQLCSLCAEDKAAISRTVAELRQKAYITSSSIKSYRAPLLLTQTGQEIAAKMEPLIQNWVCAGGDGLSDAERIDFYKSLETISKNLRLKIEAESKYHEI